MAIFNSFLYVYQRVQSLVLRSGSACRAANSSIIHRSSARRRPAFASKRACSKLLGQNAGVEASETGFWMGTTAMINKPTPAIEAADNMRF